MFQDAIEGTPEEYKQIETIIAEDVFEYMVNWMNKLTKNKICIFMT